MYYRPLPANKSPLQPTALRALPVGAVRPAGWLRDQLQIQANGLTGHLDEFWPYVSRQSGWLGGPNLYMEQHGHPRLRARHLPFSINQSASGFGDPMLEFNINLLGPKAQNNIPDVLRYEPGFSLDLLADLALPIGEYNSNQALNLGQNRWYGRIGAPMIMQIGSWVPGRRTTLELLPAVWIFGNNNDYVGQTMKTDPLFQLDAHLTRDFTEHVWGALDASWYKGGKATINGVAGDKRNDVAFGLTLGYKINDNLNLTAGYKSTVNDSAPSAMQMDSFMVTLVFGWHPLIEGSRRLKSE